MISEADSGVVTLYVVSRDLTVCNNSCFYNVNLPGSFVKQKRVCVQSAASINQVTMLMLQHCLKLFRVTLASMSIR